MCAVARGRPFVPRGDRVDTPRNVTRMASIWTARTRILVVAAGALLAINLGRQAYRWIAYEEERGELRRLGEALDASALEVMRTQLRADSLRGVIERFDDTLRAERREILAMERRADAFGLPPAIYEEYRSGLAGYNRRVGARNGAYDRWREVVASNHRFVDRYNALADSMRRLGRRMGEPYLAIPSPAEIAVRHGLDSMGVAAARAAGALD